MTDDHSPYLAWESAAELHRGHVREENQDALLNRPDIGMWAIADGMGGHTAGAAASRMVVQSLAALGSERSLENRLAAVLSGLEAVNRQLVDQARQGGNGLSGSTVAIFFTHGDQGIALWVGDSRVYRYRDGELLQLTRDHSKVQELLDRGLVSKKQAHDHPSSNIITRAIGAAATLEPDTEVIDIRVGDSFLLCSDGLYNEIDEPRIAAELASGSCASISKSLFELTLKSPARDNFAFVVAKAVLLDMTETIVNPVISKRITDV